MIGWRMAANECRVASWRSGRRDSSVEQATFRRAVRDISLRLGAPEPFIQPAAVEAPPTCHPVPPVSASKVA
jgi:hypothetical protein